MPAVRLGKLLLRWCRNCNLPILEQKLCSTCSEPTVEVKITPPGDARPAFKADIDVLKETVDRQFGRGKGELLFPDNKTIVLNKVPHLDRMDEVIIDGHVLGSLRFDPGSGYHFVLRMEGGRRLAKGLRKGFITVHKGAVGSISKKASPMVPGIAKASPSIKKGDEVIILTEDGEAIAVGIARMSGKEMMSKTRGAGAKTRWASAPCPPEVLPGGQTWEDAVAANRDNLSKVVKKAVGFVKRTVEKYDMPVAVSFSGGKDSLATLLLVLEAGLRPDILFIDTGLEFEETVEHVGAICREYDLPLVQEMAGESFWENLDRFGPPAKDYRWCCKTCKLGPAARIIKEKYPKGVLSFIGQRRYESEQRAAKKSVWKNPWVPLQIGASPIQNWTSMHIWLYLFMNGVEYNPWYEKGLERIGCWLCPSSDLAEIEAVGSEIKDYDRWQDFLHQYAERSGWGKNWIGYGGWRWKLPPQPMRELLGRRKKELKPPEDPFEFHLSEGYGPCVMGISAEGIFTSTLNIDRMRVFMNLVGEVEYDDVVRACLTERVTVFEEGVAIIKAKDEKELHETSGILERIARKAHGCVGCGTCLGQCPTDAIHIEEVALIDEEKCEHCGSCIGPCPAADFTGEFSF
ncbi:MAG: phosphoadenosine phosphosulfate reductase family protein [Methanobacteriota archaeon]|nr:MAG: phosphoadenosine phosphosulfate reductase family protein [Euryarchaeota archaeon]